VKNRALLEAGLVCVVAVLTAAFVAGGITMVLGR